MALTIPKGIKKSYQKWDKTAKAVLKRAADDNVYDIHTMHCLMKHYELTDARMKDNALLAAAWEMQKEVYHAN